MASGKQNNKQVNIHEYIYTIAKMSIITWWRLAKGLFIYNNIAAATAVYATIVNFKVYILKGEEFEVFNETYENNKKRTRVVSLLSFGLVAYGAAIAVYNNLYLEVPNFFLYVASVAMLCIGQLIAIYSIYAVHYVENDKIIAIAIYLGMSNPLKSIFLMGVLLVLISLMFENLVITAVFYPIIIISLMMFIFKRIKCDL